ncbi:hypothetical protein HK098_002651 [Nowakowskiella sp. JEL0407]|nr:hypothetical protein HK098_002651 [Nowakowskiella sp. JEL0407]
MSAMEIDDPAGNASKVEEEASTPKAKGKVVKDLSNKKRGMQLRFGLGISSLITVQFVEITLWISVRGLKLDLYPKSMILFYALVLQISIENSNSNVVFLLS